MINNSSFKVRFFIFSFIFVGLSFCYAQVDVVVTASRAEETVMQAPAHVTIISADEIESSGKSTILDIFATLSKLHISAFSSDTDAQISMRGFSENSFGRVLVLVDGIRQNNPDMKGISWLSIPLANIERIEIIDGPNSALYGNNAVGGIINIITKENTAEKKIISEIGYGMYNEALAQFIGEFSDLNWGLTSAITYFGTTGWRERTVSQTASALFNSYFDFNDFFYIKSSMQYNFTYLEYPGGISKEQFEENPRKAKNYSDDSLSHNFSLFLNPIFSFDDELTLESPISYQYKNTAYNTGSSYSIPLFSARDLHLFDVKPLLSFLTKDKENFKIDMLFGLDFSSASVTNHDFAEKKHLEKLNTFSITHIQVAPYISTKLFLPYHIALQAVIRYDFSFLSAQHFSSNLSGKTNYRALVYNLSAVYNPIKQFSLYLTAGTLFRYPFIDEAVSFSYAWIPAINYDLNPEAGYNFEMGFKLFFDTYFSAKANIYFMPMIGEITYNSQTKKNENLDNTMRIGTNLDLSSQITSFFTLSASFSYVHARFANGTYENKQIPLVSPFSAGIVFSFLLPQAITLTTDLTYKSDYFAGGDFDNKLETVSGYALWNAQITYTPPQLKKSFSFSLIAKNILNTIYAPYVYYNSYYPAKGFSFSAKVRYTF